MKKSIKKMIKNVSDAIPIIYYREFENGMKLIDMTQDLSFYVKELENGDLLVKISDKNQNVNDYIYDSDYDTLIKKAVRLVQIIERERTWTQNK